MRRRVGVALAALTLSVAGVSACGVLPALPEPLPSDFVPEPTVSPGQAAAALSPDGFAVAQRMTVRVRNVGCGFLATGTGFAVDEHTLVTNAHVVANSRRLELSTYDGRTFEVTASQRTTIADLAILHVEEPLDAFSILALEDPALGDAITVVGYPGGGRLTTTSGVVLGETQDPLDGGAGTVLGTSAVVEPGSSGSPVLNADGQVVGVIYAKNDADQSFMIPISVLNTLLQQPKLLSPDSSDCS